MKKMITKTVIGLSLLGTGAAATVAFVPSSNVVYAATQDEVGVAYNKLRALVLQARTIDPSLYTEESYTASYSSGDLRQNIPLALNMYQSITEDSVYDPSGDFIYEELLKNSGDVSGYFDYVIEVYNNDSSILTQALAGLVLKDTSGGETPPATDNDDSQAELDYTGLEAALARYNNLSQKQKDWVKSNEMVFFGDTFTLEEELGIFNAILNNRDKWESGEVNYFYDPSQFTLDSWSETFNQMADMAIANTAEDPVDTDGDGFSDADEAKAGSNPNDAKSTPSDINGDGVDDAKAKADADAAAAQKAAEEKAKVDAKVTQQSVLPATGEKSPVRATAATENAGFPVFSAIVAILGSAFVLVRKKFFA